MIGAWGKSHPTPLTHPDICLPPSMNLEPVGISPRIDCVFKTLLGSNEHKSLLLDFLSAVLQPQPGAPSDRAREGVLGCPAPNKRSLWRMIQPNKGAPAGAPLAKL